MLRVQAPELPSDVTISLAEYQREVGAGADYAERVTLAKRLFSSRNDKRNPTFAAIREALHAMCPRPGRCMYCEDSAADEIEHFYPKNLYPEFTFVWTNYLYSCGPCNGPKGQWFAVFSAETGQIVEVARSHGSDILPPKEGDPLYIDPRREDPMEFLRLDLRDTFHFHAIGARGTRPHLRATYTIDKLHLNDRDDLREMRIDAFENYAAVLFGYVTGKQAGLTGPGLAAKIAKIRRTPHPTVWFEMKRQRDRHPRLRALFSAAPEALDW
jgi:uncharacterized protein (TIGR02646 family)